MSWSEQGGRKTNKRKPAVYVAAVLAAVMMVGGIGLIVRWGNSANESSSGPRIGIVNGVPRAENEVGTQGRPDDPIPTTPRPPYAAPPTIVAAPDIRPEPLPPGAPSGPEGSVGTPEQLARQNNLANSGLSPQLYREVSNRSTDIVASMLRRDLAARYPGFFIPSPTMREWTITYATAMVPSSVSARDTYYRGVVYWKGTPSGGAPIQQATTAIYFKVGNLEPMNAVDLPRELQGDDPAVRNLYFRG